jgi:hypothetical protein
MGYPHLAFGTPRKLPPAKSLPGRVVVLDIAFASNAGGASFEKVTGAFLRGLGNRLALWIDHHDHDMHTQYADDPRFVLRTKAQHGACPELVTPERVALAGPIDSICCHGDFDGLCAAAKWIRGGVEPYAGSDDDARAIDTRIGAPSEIADVLDRALRARPRDDAMKALIVRFLVDGATDRELFSQFREASDALKAHEEGARALATRYVIEADVAVCAVPVGAPTYDKTMLLLLGQERARVSVVHDENTVAVAARFDSGINLLDMFGLTGGMPTRVSLQAKQLPEVLEALRKGF